MTMAEVKFHIQTSYEIKKKISTIEGQIAEYKRSVAAIKANRITGLPHATAVDSQLAISVERLEELNHKLTAAQVYYNLLQSKIKTMLSVLLETSDGWQILDMRSHGWEFEAIASVLNISMSTLWVRYREAVKKVAEN